MTRTKIITLIGIIGTLFITTPLQTPESPQISASMLLAVPSDTDEIRWLARCLYSESRQPREMFYVAWVVRNRVRTGYRNRTTYRDVILDPYQFSSVRQYSHLTERTVLRNPHENQAWQEAMRIARRVYEARPYENPLPRNARHFLSPAALDSLPSWTYNYQRVPVHGVDPGRFTIYE